ncbi:TlpA family protein disulfide reductase [Marinigracilibium pacificum]|uniref:Redoxin domain-containing protein n=1 Tax=Marinigracilibium pacificum TaxID=2729599 RepID=A0A848J0S4_9BACT|nr:redoxin domain-containing protein [Marinigracilibium pacificum]NMM50393.1 redoxin domain-containing protein [Marinigracilibium pacificum]
MKKIFFGIWVLVILSSIGYIFYEQEYRFLLPTPVPEDLVQVERGDSVNISSIDLSGKTFIHFYNRECPCSRFNIDEFKKMVTDYGDSVNFIAVIEATDKKELSEFISKYDLGIKTVIDNDGNIAKALGVYSTPQAVIVEDHHIFYKGNYNKARFCTSKNTRFAELALKALAAGTSPPNFPELAYISYGCELPANK